MFKLFLAGFILSAAFVVSIYSLSVTDVSDSSINFNNYKGKKILIVNTATGDSSANQQITELQQLYLQYHDSLVVIAFPSNSFGNEPGTNAAIKAVMQNTYGVTFPIAGKSEVKGENANVVYQWLGSKLQNEMADWKVKRDFQKFLVDGTGRLVARYDSLVTPMSTMMQNAITNY
jgi:glutathione peroxidase